MAAIYPNDLVKLTLAETATAVLDWLGGHSLPGGAKHGRVPQLCQLVQKAAGAIEKDDPRWRDAVQAFKDVQEYWFIIEVLGDRLLATPFIESLKLSFKDTRHPADSGKDTRGRDHQFELFLAAIATRAGLDVVRIATSGADWELRSPTRRWSLEAKRIKSWDRLEDCICKGAEQIEERRVSGAISVDISAAARPGFEPLDRYVCGEDLHRAQRARMEALLDDNEKLGQVKQWTRKTGVGFLILHDFLVVPGAKSATGEKRQWSLSGFWDCVHLVGEGSGLRERYADLWSLFGAGLPQL